MKNSGVEWIGEIPQEWETWKLKHVASIQTGNTPTKTNVDNYSEVGLLWVKPDNLKELKPIEETNEYISDEGKQLARIANAYSTLVCCIGTVGKIGYSNVPVAFNQQINAVDFDCDKILWKYGLYFLSCQKEQHQYYMNGNVVYILNSENHGRIKIAKPELSEQQAISDYLDKKCAEIDAVISSKQEQNKLLKEQRQSIIYEAVTKGLDKNAPMKDSGVEWIGEIPREWRVFRLKHLLSDRKGSLKAGPFGSSLKSSDMQDSKIKVYNQRSVLDNDFEQGEEYISYEKFEELKGFQVDEGDLLITTRGTIGKTAIVPQGAQKGILHPCLMGMRLNPNLVYINLFSKIFNDTNLFLEQLKLSSNATTIEVIYTQNLSEIYVPIASVLEQREIAEYLDIKCAELDQLLQANITTINELKEYRQSVIFEAVTGKMEIG